MPTRFLTSVFLAAYLLLFLNMPRSLNVVDEGIILSNAVRVLHGDVLHRDFYSNYGPGQYYLVAAMFRLFGQEWIVARIYDIAIRAAVVTAIVFILDKQGSRSIALAFGVISAIWLTASEFYLYPIFPCMLLSLVGSYLIAAIDQQRVPRWRVLLAGVCTGATVVIRYEVGFLLLLAHVLSFSVLLATRVSRGAYFRALVTRIAVYGMGVSVIFVPVAFAFLSVAPADAFIADIIDYPLHYYSLMRSLPFPTFGSVGIARTVYAICSVYLPLVAGSLVVVEFVRRALNRRTSEADDRLGTAYLIVFGSTAVALFAKGVVRVSTIHMLLGIVPSLVVFGVLIQSWWKEGRSMGIAAVIGMLIVISSPLKDSIESIREHLSEQDRSMARYLLQRMGMLPAPESDICGYTRHTGIAKLGSDYARVANYLDTHTRPDERILAALDRHDKIFVNPVGLYFASGRPPPTRWHQFDPGLVSRADIQAAIIADLKQKDVRWIVRDGHFSETNEPNGSAQSSGVVLLDNYIDANYRPVALAGKISIWLRNGESPLALRAAEGCEAGPVP